MFAKCDELDKVSFFPLFAQGKLSFVSFLCFSAHWFRSFPENFFSLFADFFFCFRVWKFYFCLCFVFDLLFHSQKVTFV